MSWTYPNLSEPYSPAMYRAFRVRTLADMSEKEIKALEQQYGCPVQRPTKMKGTTPSTNSFAVPSGRGRRLRGTTK